MLPFMFPVLGEEIGVFTPIKPSIAATLKKFDSLRLILPRNDTAFINALVVLSENGNSSRNVGGATIKK